MKKHILFLMALLCLGASLQAQNLTTILKGNFSHATTGQPVTGVKLYYIIRNSNGGGGQLGLSVFSDANGDYEIVESLSPGNYLLETRYGDCDSMQITPPLFSFSAGDTLVTNFDYCQNGIGCRAYISYNRTNATVDFIANQLNGVAPFTYTWDFGDGNTSTLANPTHAYSAAGSYNVTLISTDATGCTDTAFNWVSISTVNCSANFTHSTNNNTVSFTSNVSGTAPFSYNWDFGDGNTSALANPDHTYPNPGNYPYSVSLTITDATGCTTTHSKTVNRVYTTTINGTVTDGTTGLPVPNVQINIQLDYLSGGSGIIGSTTDQNGNYSYTGNYLPDSVLCRIDMFNCDSNWVRTIPTALPLGDTLTTDLVYCQTGGGYSCGVTMRVTRFGGDYYFGAISYGAAPFTYNWDFGDGNTSTQASPVHTYTTNGNYVASVVSTDQYGCSDTAFYSTNINNVSCSAGIGYGQWGQNGARVDFNPRLSGIPPYTFSWDFGDGNTSNLQSPTHYYSSNGTFQVNLTITDSVGCVSTDQASVTVNAGCSSDFSYSLTGLRELSFTPTSWGIAPVTYSWDFGDGNSSNSNNPVHVYAADGTYLVNIVSTDSSGCTDSLSKSIVINSKLGGWVSTTDSNQVINHGTAYLIKVDSTPAGLSLNLIDSVDITQNSYLFTDVAGGSYLVKAALKPNSPYYADNLPTYHSSFLTWDSAISVQKYISRASANILLISGINPGGPGFIGGLVSQGANKTTGPVLEGIQVNLLNADGSPVAYTYTDANGEYEFSNLAYGDYIIHVEVLGIPSQDINVTIDANNPSVSGKDFEVGTDMVSIATHLESAFRPESIKIFPNPVKESLKVNIEISRMASVQLRIMDLLGKEVLVITEGEQIGENTFKLNTSQLLPGVYLLKIQLGDEMIVEKIVKN
ncbi:MAG: PKD domain-containing protein [Bacteroidia bacterium]|nr:PKD domain-containing protein [Bacteroidia bacterium]